MKAYTLSMFIEDIEMNLMDVKAGRITPEKFLFYVLCNANEAAEEEK